MNTQSCCATRYSPAVDGCHRVLRLGALVKISEGSSVAKLKRGSKFRRANGGNRADQAEAATSMTSAGPAGEELPGLGLVGESGSGQPGSRVMIGSGQPDAGVVVRAAIARHLDVRPGEVTGDTHLQLDLGLRDAQRLLLLNTMGEALDVRFPDDFFDGVHTVDQLTTAIRVSLSPL